MDAAFCCAGRLAPEKARSLWRVREPVGILYPMTELFWFATGREYTALEIPTPSACATALGNFFPELANRELSIRPGGKMGIEVRTQELAIQVAAGSPIDHLVFLDRLPQETRALSRAIPMRRCPGATHVRVMAKRAFGRPSAAAIGGF